VIINLISIVIILLCLNIVFIIPIGILFKANSDNNIQGQPPFDDSDGDGDGDGDNDPSVLAEILAFLNRHKLEIAYGVLAICCAYLVYDNWDTVQKIASYFLPKRDGTPSIPAPTTSTTTQTLDLRQSFQHPDMNLESTPARIRRRLRETQLSFQFLDALAEQRLARINSETGKFQSDTYTLLLPTNNPYIPDDTEYTNAHYARILNKAYNNSFKIIVDKDFPLPPGLREAFLNVQRELESAPLKIQEAKTPGIQVEYGKFSSKVYDTCNLLEELGHRSRGYLPLADRESDTALRVLIEPTRKYYTFTEKYYKFKPFDNPFIQEIHTEGFLKDEFKNMYAASLLIVNDEPAGGELIEKLNLDPVKTKKVAQNYIEQMNIIVDELNTMEHATKRREPCFCRELWAFYEVSDIQFGFFSRGLTRQAVENAIVSGAEITYHEEYERAYEQKFKNLSPAYKFWKKTIK
jgi:hypothetical protein